MIFRRGSPGVSFSPGSQAKIRRNPHWMYIVRSSTAGYQEPELYN